MYRAPVPPVTLAEVIADLVAQTRAHCIPTLAKRLDRAAVIAQTPYAIHAGPDAETTCVHSLTDWATTYLVRGNACTCPDALRRGGLPCKHALAVGLLSRATVEQRHRQRARDFGEPVTPTCPACLAHDRRVVELAADAQCPACRRRFTLDWTTRYELTADGAALLAEGE